MQSFGGRLRHERERRHIDLKSIAESTKISIPLLEGLERGDVSRWPSGIFRKSFIRSYAEAIGLDPEPVVREFIELYPDPLEVEIQPTDRNARDRGASSQPATSQSSTEPLCHQTHHYLERISAPHYWKIGGLEDCEENPIFQSVNVSMVTASTPARHTRCTFPVRG